MRDTRAVIVRQTTTLFLFLFFVLFFCFFDIYFCSDAFSSCSIPRGIRSIQGAGVDPNAPLDLPEYGDAVFADHSLSFATPRLSNAYGEAVTRANIPESNDPVIQRRARNSSSGMIVCLSVMCVM